MSLHDTPLSNSVSADTPLASQELQTARHSVDRRETRILAAGMPEVSDANDGPDLYEGYDDEARFELLSAYIDDEVDAEERRLVDSWLMEDTATQQMYRRLLMLRQAIRTTPLPEQSLLEVPKQPRSWKASCTTGLRWALVCAAATALIGGVSQMGITNARRHFEDAWRSIQVLPQDKSLELVLDRSSHM